MAAPAGRGGRRRGRVGKDVRIRTSLVGRRRVGDPGLPGPVGCTVQLDRPLGAVLRRRLRGRSASRPVALAPVVVWAAGVFTLFWVCHFAVWAASVPFEGDAGVRAVRFDVVKAPVGHVPSTLIDQLAVGGRSILQVGPPGEPQERQVLTVRTTARWTGCQCSSGSWPNSRAGWAGRTADLRIKAPDSRRRRPRSESGRRR